MEDTITFNVTITGRYSVPRSKLQECYSTDDEKLAAQIDTDHYNDFPEDALYALNASSIHVEVATGVVE